MISASQRFSPKVDTVLRRAGWYSGRNLKRFEYAAGWPVFPKVTEILREFDGILAGRVWEPSVFPAISGYYLEVTSRCRTKLQEYKDEGNFSAIQEEIIHPIGMSEFRNGQLFIGQSGKIYLSWDDGDLEDYCSSFDEAVERLLVNDKSTFRDFCSALKASYGFK
jgi:SUKH-3 immunity protein